MRRLKSILLAAVTVTAMQTLPAHAQRFDGRWSGTLVTDALRGDLELVITALSGATSIMTSLSARERRIDDQADSVVIDGDSIRFANDIAGARVRFAGVLKGGDITGTVAVFQGAQQVTSGQWSVTRAAPPTQTAPHSQAVAVLAAAWTALDRGYGNFTCKTIDWAAVRPAFENAAAASTDDTMLFSTLSEMLGTLNDIHISLEGGGRRFSSGSLSASRRGEFDIQVVRDKYLRGKLTNMADGALAYGWLNDSIGYIRVSQYRGAPATAAAMDSIIGRFSTARSLVIDIRDNPGGSDEAGQQILHRMADQRRLYFTSRARGIGGHDALLAPKHFYLDPAQAQRTFTRPIVVLTNSRSVSAAENFLLGVRELPHATVIGDVTAGGFSDFTTVNLPNGWTLRFPMNNMVDARGVCWEGLGVPPDVRIVNEPGDVQKGTDAVLNFALRFLKTVH